MVHVRHFSNSRIVLLALAVGCLTWPATAAADKPNSGKKPPAATSPDPSLAPSAPAPAVQQSPALSAPLTPDAIEEILRLRRAMGVSESLQVGPKDGGAPLSPDDQFRQALLTLAGQAPSLPPAPAAVQAARPQSIDSLPPPVVDPTAERDRAVELIPAQGSAKSPGDESLESFGADMIVVASLRDTSRMLDSRAHDLDEARRFDEADKLRRLAARLRKEARRIESTVMAHEASVSSS